MDDLDRMLNALAGQARHPRLEGMETRLLARIAADRREPELPLSLSLAMIATALGIGLVSGQASAARAPQGALSLSVGVELAPSTRLVAKG